MFYNLGFLWHVSDLRQTPFRCRRQIENAERVLATRASEDIAVLRQARETLGDVCHEVARLAFDNATGPTFVATSMQDAVDHIMKMHKK